MELFLRDDKMEKDDVKTQLFSEIIKILEIKPSEVATISDDFKELMSGIGNTPEDMIRSCKIYDSASFMAGAMITTTILDLVRNVHAEKLAERDRLEGNCMDAM